VADLAKVVGCGARSLRRDFQREYGTSVQEHGRRVRVLHVIDRFSNVTEKIEPIAMEAGFRSKNGLYSAFHKLIGMTPTEFRQLPVPRASQIVESVKASLLKRVACRQAPDIGRVFVSRKH
jgi:AraC-like DNA-binding protein